MCFFVENHFNRFKPLFLFVCLFRQSTTFDYNSKVNEKTVYYVNDNYLVACFDQDITEETITQIAKEKPYYFVMRDSGFASDSVATNFEQIFTTYSADTVRKVL